VVCPEGESEPVSVSKSCNVGINDNEQMKFRVYPNPAKNELRITNYELRITNVEIFDVFGRKQKAESRKEKGEREVVVNVSHLAAGVYFLRIYSETGITIKNVVISN
jgi:hypothetical protein